MDKDESAIGGLSKPMKPTKQLFYLTCTMDVISILAGTIVIDLTFGIGLLLYILASRAYSYRGIRLKKYPVAGYLTVIIFQGGFIFALVYYSCNVERSLDVPLVCVLASTFLIGGYYPLTQIYQFEEDKKDGVKTISMLLGKRGTFIFCAIIFSLAATCIWYLAYILKTDKILYLFLAIMTPVLVYFLWWMNAVWKNPQKADFKNSLLMNIIASGCTCIYFITLIFLK
jgi:1,4-dihydroxy-2-naphthoate octaprenyltransferase